ncbi:MAG: type II secretion system protein [Erysipelotrichaceae bacterium]
MKKNGFTMMEMMIVIGMISILLFVGSFPLSTYLNFKDSDTLGFMNKSANQAVASYYTLKGEFPTTSNITLPSKSGVNGVSDTDIESVLNELQNVTKITISNNFDNVRYKANIAYYNEYTYKLTFEKR